MMTNAQDLFHTSPVAIDKIDRFGRFDSFLFFSLDYDVHGSQVATKRVYKISIDADQILEASQMWYEHDDESDEVKVIIEEAAELLDVSYDEALECLDESNSIEMDADTSWNMQTLTAKCAVALGYRGVQVTDEHGPSYMIDMLGREDELEDVTK